MNERVRSPALGVGGKTGVGVLASALNNEGVPRACASVILIFLVCDDHRAAEGQ